jgi:hypothetical protein
MRQHPMPSNPQIEASSPLRIPPCDIMASSTVTRRERCNVCELNTCCQSGTLVNLSDSPSESNQYDGASVGSQSGSMSERWSMSVLLATSLTETKRFASAHDNTLQKLRSLAVRPSSLHTRGYLHLQTYRFDHSRHQERPVRLKHAKMSPVACLAVTLAAFIVGVALFDTASVAADTLLRHREDQAPLPADGNFTLERCCL